MRVTLVSPYDPLPSATAAHRAHVGGVERVFAELAKRLATRGHEVTLLSSSAEGSGEWLEKGLREIKVRRAGTLLRAPLVHLARHVPKDADIVHVAATYPFTTPSVLKRARALDIPSILDFHFEPAPGNDLGRIAADLYRRVGPPSYRLAERVIVRSHAYGRRAPSLRGIPEERWRVVPNGIEPERFHPDGATGEGDYLLFVGRLVPYKGLSVLLRALAKADIRMPLNIIGDGPLRKELEALASRLGVDVRFLGHVPDDELPRWYRGARLTLLPSVTSQEAFGISLIESMACGTPVVASGLPGVKEVAEVGGLVARPRDPNALALQIGRALEPGRLLRGDALARRVHARFSWDAVTDRVLEVYDEALGRGASKGALPQPEVSVLAHPRGHSVL